MIVTLSARLATPAQENRPPNSPKDKYTTHQTPPQPHTAKNSNFSFLHSGHTKVGCSRVLTKATALLTNPTPQAAADGN